MKVILGHVLVILSPFALAGVLVLGAGAMIAAEVAADRPRRDVGLPLAPSTWKQVSLAFDRGVGRAIDRDLRAAITSEKLSDGAVPGLVVVTMERETARHLIATLATALDCEVHERHIHRDPDPRKPR